jgi:hypothetical protein
MISIGVEVNAGAAVAVAVAIGATVGVFAADEAPALLKLAAEPYTLTSAR